MRKKANDTIRSLSCTFTICVLIFFFEFLFRSIDLVICAITCINRSKIIVVSLSISYSVPLPSCPSTLCLFSLPLPPSSPSSFPSSSPSSSPSSFPSSSSSSSSFPSSPRPLRPPSPPPPPPFHPSFSSSSLTLPSSYSLTTSPTWASPG